MPGEYFTAREDGVHDIELAANNTTFDDLYVLIKGVGTTSPMAIELLFRFREAKSIIDEMYIRGDEQGSDLAVIFFHRQDLINEPSPYQENLDLTAAAFLVCATAVQEFCGSDDAEGRLKVIYDLKALKLVCDDEIMLETGGGNDVFEVGATSFEIADHKGFQLERMEQLRKAFSALDQTLRDSVMPGEVLKWVLFRLQGIFRWAERLVVHTAV